LLSLREAQQACTASNVMPTEVGTQSEIRTRYVDAWLDPGLRRDDGLSLFVILGRAR